MPALEPLASSRARGPGGPSDSGASPNGARRYQFVTELYGQ